MEPKRPLPNATATLILGILSIVMCWCYGIIGIILGVIALVISSNSVRLYKENPQDFDGYGNLNAGRITAMIGIGLSILYIILLVAVLLLSPDLMPQIMDQYR